MTPKLWYTSKLVWLGILQTVFAILMSASDLVSKGALTPQDALVFLAGICTIVIRVWLTDTAIQR